MPAYIAVWYEGTGVDVCPHDDEARAIRWFRRVGKRRSSAQCSLFRIKGRRGVWTAGYADGEFYKKED